MSSNTKDMDIYTIKKFIDADKCDFNALMRKTYEQLLGGTNSKEFLGFTRGSLLCTNISGIRICQYSSKWELDYTFYHIVGKWTIAGYLHDPIFGTRYYGYTSVNFYDYGFDKFDQLTKEWRDGNI